jgi:AAA-like domain
MTVEEALVIVDAVLAPERLNFVQELVFRNCWAGQTYQQIAQDAGYDADYIRIIGSRLWQALAKATGEKVTKNNIHAVVRRCSGSEGVKTANPAIIAATQPAQNIRTPLPEFPDGPRPLNCLYYVECSSTLEDCYNEILNPGALIRIKAPEKRGKSSLMLRILAYAESHGYRTVRLNLQQVEQGALANLDRFLRWLCANITQQLGLEPNLNQYWDSDLGSKISSTTYLQGYVLPLLDRPLVVALDETHRLFEYPEIAQDFLPLLRLWHEEANNLGVWGNLRLMVVYSTEVYIPLALNQSPFNVGLPIRLPKFDLQQTQTLAERYGLISNHDFEQKHLMSLRAMVDGHPYLLSLACYHFSRGEISMETLLQNAPTQTSIYSDHLRSQLIVLQNSPALSTAFTAVVTADTAVRLDAIAAYQLESMGLVNLHGDMATPSCDLYRLYFRDRLS